MAFCFSYSSFFTAGFPQPTAHNSFSKSRTPTKHTLKSYGWLLAFAKAKAG
jgi:hypothetical protein